MITAHVQYPLTDLVYRNLLFAISKRGYKVKTFVKGFGMITARKTFLFKSNLDLMARAKAKGSSSSKIEITITRKDISNTKEEQKMIDTIYKYF